MAEYITKKTVLTIVALHYSISKNTCCRQLCDALFRQIKEEPAADVIERKHGKWVEYPEVLKLTDALNDEYIGCSVCETVCNMMDNDVERFNFCPNCGADMRGDNDV